MLNIIKKSISICLSIMLAISMISISNKNLTYAEGFHEVIPYQIDENTYILFDNENDYMQYLNTIRQRSGETVKDTYIRTAKDVNYGWVSRVNNEWARPSEYTRGSGSTVEGTLSVAYEGFGFSMKISKTFSSTTTWSVASGTLDSSRNSDLGIWHSYKLDYYRFDYYTASGKLYDTKYEYILIKLGLPYVGPCYETGSTRCGYSLYSWKF